MNQTKPNRMARALAKANKAPAFLRPWLVDRALGNAVKLVGTCGLHFDKIDKHEFIVTVKNKTKVQNHIGQIHAATMILLAETATGLLVGYNMPDDKIPLIKSLNTRFLRRTEGSMKAVAQLSDDQIAMIHREDKGETLVPVVVTDATGEEVISCEALWAWIPKKRM